MYRAYRSESGWQLNAGRECGKQAVVLAAAQHPLRGVRAQQFRCRSKEARQLFQPAGVEGDRDVAGPGQPPTVPQESVGKSVWFRLSV